MEVEGIVPLSAPLKRKYQAKGLLGRGMFANVYLSVSDDGEEFATKVVPWQYSPADKDLIISHRLGTSELAFMSSFSHPTIVRMEDLFVQKNTIAYVMEKGDITLHELLGFNIADEKKIGLMYDIGSAVSYLHRNNIIHGDLKDENVIIFNKGDSIIAKLADFGLAVTTYVPENRAVQNKAYAAPEIMYKRGYAGFIILYPWKPCYKYRFHTLDDNLVKAEAWSFGLLCLQIVYTIKSTFELPSVPSIKSILPGMNYEHDYERLVNYLVLNEDDLVRAFTDIYGPSTMLFSYEILKSIAKLFTPDPTQRANVTKFISLPLFKEVARDISIKLSLHYTLPNKVPFDTQSFKLVEKIAKLKAIPPGILLGLFDFIAQNHIVFCEGDCDRMKFNIFVFAALWLFCSTYKIKFKIGEITDLLLGTIEPRDIAIMAVAIIRRKKGSILCDSSQYHIKRNIEALVLYDIAIHNINDYIELGRPEEVVEKIRTLLQIPPTYRDTIETVRFYRELSISGY